MEINKENVSPIKPSVIAGDKDVIVDGLADSFQKRFEINGIDKDGRYFLDVMKRETDRLLSLSESSEKAMNEDTPSEEGNLYFYYKQHRWLETVDISTSLQKITFLHNYLPIHLDI